MALPIYDKVKIISVLKRWWQTDVVLVNVLILLLLAEYSCVKTQSLRKPCDVLLCCCNEDTAWTGLERYLAMLEFSELLMRVGNRGKMQCRCSVV